MNKIIVIGNLGKDPEMRYTNNGRAMTSFSIASNYKRSDGERETTWFEVTAFGRQAEVLNEHLRKGDPLYVEGRLRLRTYITKAGKEGCSLDVTLAAFHLLGGRRDTNGTSEDERPQFHPAKTGVAQEAEEELDLPF